MDNAEVLEKYTQVTKLLGEISGPVKVDFTGANYTLSCPDCGSIFTTVAAWSTWTPFAPIFCCGKLRMMGSD